MKTPPKRHRLQRDPVEILSSSLRLNSSLSGDDVLYALEHAIGHPLPAELRARVGHLVDPAAAKHGRPPASPNERAVLDFVMKELDEAYPILLAQFQTDKADAGGQSASERAYRKLAEDNAKDFEMLFEWRSLQNKHLAWRKQQQNMQDQLVDSEDFDAEIDRQFPRSQ